MLLDKELTDSRNRKKKTKKKQKREKFCIRHSAIINAYELNIF